MIDLSKQTQYKQLEIDGCWHLAYYIPSNRAIGTLAGKLINFKDGVPNIVKGWCNWASDELSKLDIDFDYIVRALGSNELTPTKGKSCAALGRHLAESLDVSYIPTLLSKKRATKPMHTLRTYQERYDELHGVYVAHDIGEDLNGNNVLIIDDITTTNCTIAEIKRAITEKWPSVNLYLFCLGRTDYDSKANDAITQEYFK